MLCRTLFAFVSLSVFVFCVSKGQPSACYFIPVLSLVKNCHCRQLFECALTANIRQLYVKYKQVALLSCTDIYENGLSSEKTPHILKQLLNECAKSEKMNYLRKKLQKAL